MNKEEQTIKKIQELVPEITELKFGCKIKQKDNNEECGIFIMFSPVIATSETDYKYTDREGLHLYLYSEKNSPQVFTLENFNKWYEILGRDITLEDVLLAIMKNDETFKGKGLSGECYELASIWQLNKPFHEQSQETKDFIGDLLVK